MLTQFLKQPVGIAPETGSRARCGNWAKCSLSSGPPVCRCRVFSPGFPKKFGAALSAGGGGRSPFLYPRERKTETDRERERGNARNGQLAHSKKTGEHRTESRPASVSSRTSQESMNPRLSELTRTLRFLAVLAACLLHCMTDPAHFIWTWGSYTKFTTMCDHL